MVSPSGSLNANKTPFNYNYKQMLNGVDTVTFDHIVATIGDSNRFTEGATNLLVVNGTARLFGNIKDKNVKQSQKLESITIESALAKLRDTETSSPDALRISPALDVMNCILPVKPTDDGGTVPEFKIEYNATINPRISYAVRSGSILTHLNTICAMSGLNWRYKCDPATEGVDEVDRSIIVVTDGVVDAIKDRPVWVENKDIFQLTLDTSLYKKYNQVNVIGVEKEISGYTCTASLKSPTFFYMDCDDGTLGEDEIIPANDPHTFLTNVGALDRIWIQDMKYTDGWEKNHIFLVDDEFIGYEDVYVNSRNKENQGVKGITRAQWFSSGNTPHVYGAGCLITQGIHIKPADTTKPITISPATTLFRIGSEVIRIKSFAEGFTQTQLHLATVATTGNHNYLGRGQLESPMYSHRKGAIIQPYYTPESAYPATHFMSASEAQYDQTLQITIHGKGITTQDGIDKLAWGVLLNIQNGILSGSGTFKSSDFYSPELQVGKLITIEPANRIGEPATSYDMMIYSITRKQNSLLTVEFGNVAPEVLHMLKSGDYALQAAIRKDDALTSVSVGTVSLGGTLALSSTDNRYRKFRVGGW